MCSLILRAKNETVREKIENVKNKDQSEKLKKALELSAVSSEGHCVLMSQGHRAALSHTALKEQESQKERGRWRGDEGGRWKERMKGRTRKREQTQVNIYNIKSTFTLSCPLQLVCCLLIFPDFSLRSSIFRLETRQ